jgi:L-phenylalanine/L-methionine N-acetyltransferase
LRGARLIPTPSRGNIRVDIFVRHAEPDDYEAIHRILSGPRATAGTMQLPLQSVENVRKRFLESPEGLYHLVACVEGEVVGHLGLETLPTRPRRRHVGSLGMAVRDDLQGRGVGTALMEAALDLADNWLGLTRVELQVYTDNEIGTSFRESETSSGSASGSSSSQNTPVTSGVPSSPTTTRSLNIL